MNRRAFFLGSGQSLTLALAASLCKSPLLFGQTRSGVHPDTLEQRMAAIIQAYDAQGNHRTGTEVDKLSAEWLAGEIHQFGLVPALEAFPLNRIDPRSCYLRLAGRRIDSVPLFDGNFTSDEGIHGRLGPLGSDAKIGLAEGDTSTFAGLANEEFRRSQHKAVVLITLGKTPGLYLLNAPSFRNPSGPPTLQVSGTEREWLWEQARNGVEATLVASVKRTHTQAFNVTTQIRGSNPKLAPLVFSTPRSGWWQCASERGGGLACWLESMRVLASGKSARDCFFVALSAHELGEFGIEGYLEHRKDLVKRAKLWIHFGANIGAARQPNIIKASNEETEQWATAAMEKEGLTVNQKMPRSSIPFGEAGAVHTGGGRYVAVVCENELFFHNAADRWPEAVDVSLLGRYAKAFANAALALAVTET